MVRKSVPGLGIRWTIGDVSEPGREVLRFSILGAWKVFGPSASYVVCVNSCDADGLRRSLGELPQAVRWMQVPAMNPAFLPFCDASLSEGTAWKFSPVRCFPDRHELALDNDVVLWRCPPAVRRWLSQPSAFLLGADVVPANGSFSDLTDPVALNSGIRGFPPGFDYEARLLETLRQTGRTLRAELDEQGLQVAVMTSSGVCHVVSLEDVTICSPFPPHVAYLGRCGAHFVGLNARSLPWNYYGRPATECRLEHWCLHRAPVGNLVTRRARRTTVTRRPQRVGRARRKSSYGHTTAAASDHRHDVKASDGEHGDLSGQSSHGGHGGRTKV